VVKEFEIKEGRGGKATCRQTIGRCKKRAQGRSDPVLIEVVRAEDLQCEQHGEGESDCIAVQEEEVMGEELVVSELEELELDDENLPGEEEGTRTE